MSEEKATMWRKWGSVVLGGLLLLLIGFEVGAEGMRMKSHDGDAAVAEAKAKVEEATKTLADAKEEIEKQRTQAERFKAGYVDAMERVSSLAQQLKETRGGVTDQAIQCQQWNPQPQQTLPPADASSFTVLYESGRASLHVSLLPFPGAPRVALDSGSQLAPRWILPGRLQPKMVGQTRQALYYYFDPATSTWQGPFAPPRVTQ